jgi:hypothetical protein
MNACPPVLEVSPVVFTEVHTVTAPRAVDHVRDTPLDYVSTSQRTTRLAVTSGPKLVSVSCPTSARVRLELAPLPHP